MAQFACGGMGIMVRYLHLYRERRPLVKLKNEIVLGMGCKLAIAVCLLALAGAYADGLTPMYGKASGTQGDIATTVAWYSNEAMTSTTGVITPWQEGSNTCRYAILGVTKITGNSSLPDVPFCFGTDGVTIGTKVTKSSYNTACGITMTFPQLTIYSGTFMANSESTIPATLKGHCTFVKTSQSIDFGSTYVKSARGWELAGTFVAASDVTLNIYMTLDNGFVGTGVGTFVCSGDFSAFKGRVFMSSKVPDRGDNMDYYEVRLASPTALGDTSYPRTDALTLKHRAHLVMTDNVVQDGTRGITLDLADGDFACLDAAANADWTLKAPLYGSTGTLKKVGAGTVTLVGSVEVEDIVVTNGTLVVAPGAMFADDAHITVKAGGKLVSRGRTNLPAFTVEEGGEFAYDFTVPYENGETTVLDYTGFTAAEYGSQTKPIAVSLSQKMTLPINETNRLALARFDAAAGATSADFTDITARTYDRLPTTWLETETADGVTTLYLVARPAIRYIREGSDNSLGTAANWSDGKAPHGGADYYSDTITISSTRTGGGGAIASFNFGGETLTLKNGVWDYAQDFYVQELRLLGGSPMTVVHASSRVDGVQIFNENFWPRILRGTYEISKSATDSNPASIVLDMRTRYADLRQTLVGTGSLRISTEVRAEEDGGQGLFPVYFSGMNGDFGGRLCVTTVHNKAVMDMYVTNGLAFGGPLSVYSANAVRILPMSKTMDGAVSITATADMTVDAANRGWYMTSCTLGASNGVTFVFAPPRLSVKNKLCKTGGGTLALGCDTVGGGRTFAVKEGYVKALSADCCTNLNLTVSAGAGIKADLAPANATVAAKGLIAKSILPAEASGKILAAVDMPEGDEPKFSAVICTVPSSQADLSTTLMPANIHGYTGRIENDAATYAAEGLVTYKATWTKTGFTVIFR